MSKFSEFDRYDGVGLAELVRRGEVSADELLDASIALVESRNPVVNAVISRLYDEAHAAIRAGLPVGPFTGVPYLLKDVVARYRGAVTSFGSRLFADDRADHDSEITARLKRAGLVIFGKTNVPELAFCPSTEPRLFGATRNPWNLGYSAGGSSGGSAAPLPPGWFRWRTRLMEPDLFGFLRPVAVCSASSPRAPATHLALIKERGGAEPIPHTRSRAQCEIAPRCSTRPRGQISEIRTARRRRRDLSCKRSAGRLAGCGSPLRLNPGPVLPSMLSAPLRRVRPHPCARALAIAWRRHVLRST
jgi:hypothetical protein